MTKPIEDMLKCAAEEIRSLRRRNELLQAKVDMIALFEMVLHTKPAEPTQSTGIDYAWAADNLALNLSAEREHKELSS